MNHLHDWEEVRRTWCPSPNYAFDLRADRETFNRALFGITSVELRCKSCGELSNRVLLGKCLPMIHPEHGKSHPEGT